HAVSTNSNPHAIRIDVTNNSGGTVSIDRLMLVRGKSPTSYAPRTQQFELNGAGTSENPDISSFSGGSAGGGDGSQITAGTQGWAGGGGGGVGGSNTFPLRSFIGVKKPRPKARSP